MADDLRCEHGVQIGRMCEECVSQWLKKTSSPQLTPTDLLRAAAETFQARNPTYGNNYKDSFPAVMMALFPDGIQIQTMEEWARMGVFVQIVSKLTRYAARIKAGGHKDSAHDMTVYSAMLEELTQIGE